MGKLVSVLEQPSGMDYVRGLRFRCIGSVCTDGAPVMRGNQSGFSVLMKREIPHLQVTPWFFHHRALAAKSLPRKLKKYSTLV